MRRASAIAALTGGLAFAGPASANDWPARFAATFRDACVPQRLSYEGTVAHARSVGWLDFDTSGHREFATMKAKSAAGMEEAKADMPEMTYAETALAREVDGRALHLIVSFMTSQYLDAVGCYLYDFEATEPVPASAVTNILGVKPAQSQRDETMTAYVWGPPPSMPRTLDTYLIFVPPGSPHVEKGGFDGQVLKFTNSAPER